MKTVLVTLANRSYLDAARQLFAGAHVAGGWQGDYLLLTHDVPSSSVQDFLDRGIHVHPAAPVNGVALPERIAAIIAKFGLFDPFMKQWDRVVYLDGDIVIRARLGAALFRPRFGAVRDVLNLRAQYGPGPGPDGLVNAPAFNAGLLSFDTTLIGENTRQDLLNLWLRHWQTTRLVDQPALNYFFRNAWEALPFDFNVFANLSIFGRRWPDHRRGTVMHFTNSPKPWDEGCPAQPEWQENLRRFKELDPGKRVAGREWTASERLCNAIIQQLRFRLARADVRVGETAAMMRERRGKQA